MSSNKVKKGSYRWGHHAAQRHVQHKEALATRRRKRRYLILGSLTVCVLVLFGAVAWATHTNEFRIQEVIVQGAAELPEDLVRTSVETRLAHDRLHLIARDNALMFSKGEVATILKDEFPRIKTAVVHVEGVVRPLVRVSITERTPKALWCAQDDTCFFMDEDGFIFAYADSFAEYVRYMGGKVEKDRAIGSVFIDSFKNLETLVGAFNRTGNDTRTARVFDEYISLELTRGFAVHISKAVVNPDALSETLSLVLASDVLRGKTALLEYVDLRFGNRVYYKFVGEDSAGSLEE